MTKTLRIFDTRYFWEMFAEKDVEFVSKLRELAGERWGRHISAVTLYEVYKLTLGLEGREVAELRCSLIERDMQVVPVDSAIAKEAARIGQRFKVPIADAIIMATARILGAECITDDEHFRGVKTRWSSLEV